MEKLVVAEIIKKFLEFYRTRSFVMVRILSNKCTQEYRLQNASARRCHHQGAITTKGVVYPGILFGGGVQQIQLRTEDRENGDLGAVAS
jgi:hypothetical protein